MRKVSISFLSHPWIIKGLIFPTSQEDGALKQIQVDQEYDIYFIRVVG